MGRYLSSRLIQIVIALLVVIIIVFFLSRLTGDPASLMLPTNATQEQVENLRSRLGLDQPLWRQFFIYMKGVLLKGDFGESYRYNESALKLIVYRCLPTIKLTLFSLFIALIIGLPTGIISGLNSGSWIDAGIQSFALIGQSIPTFWLGIMLINIFAVNLKLLPVMGAGSFQNLILPGLTLGFPTSALIARMLRSSILEVCKKDYVRTARAKGLTENVVVFMHILRNSLIPVITIVMLQMGYLMGGAVVTETVFTYPGMGLLAIQSIYGRDFVVIQAFIVIVAGIIMMLNFIADIIYLLINPKLKYER